MIFKGSTYMFYFTTISVLLFEISCTAGKFRVNGRTSTIYTSAANKFLQNMDLSVDPCTHFYNFTCGGYMKKNISLEAVSPGYDLYTKMIKQIQDIVESERDIPGSDVSVARNIYTNCINIIPDVSSETELIDSIATKLGLITDKYKMENGTVRYEWNKKFDWIDGVHKLREMGLNFRFLLGLYVSPRSQSDKRNILEIREPFLKTDDKQIFLSVNQENLTIVNAGEYIKSLNGSFPLQKFIEGLLPKDANFSLKDEIRIDETYINLLVEALRNTSASYWAKKLHNKLSSEIKRVLLSKEEEEAEEEEEVDREEECLHRAIYYDYNFQVTVSKMFLSEEQKSFATEIVNNIIKTSKMLINNSENFDEESRIKSIKDLSNLQLLFGYGNNTIEQPELDWNDVDYQKYVYNILTLSKYQMDAKFRQLNLVNDVREWNLKMIPSTYNAAYFPISNSLYMPALFLKSSIYKLDLPNFIHYGSFGFIMGHELGHAIDFTTNYGRFVEVSHDYNFAGSNVRETKQCLREAFYDLTGKYKFSEVDDFADLAGYKIAYYSLLDSENKNEYENLLPGLNYNSRQMFWISSASTWCSKVAFEHPGDQIHSPGYSRVLIPLSNLPEFARDFNCPIGSPMNPETKCEFL